MFRTMKNMYAALARDKTITGRVKCQMMSKSGFNPEDGPEEKPLRGNHPRRKPNIDMVRMAKRKLGHVKINKKIIDNNISPGCPCLKPEIDPNINANRALRIVDGNRSARVQ